MGRAEYERYSIWRTLTDFWRQITRQTWPPDALPTLLSGPSSVAVNVRAPKHGGEFVRLILTTIVAATALGGCASKSSEITAAYV